MVEPRISIRIPAEDVVAAVAALAESVKRCREREEEFLSMAKETPRKKKRYEQEARFWASQRKCYEAAKAHISAEYYFRNHMGSPP